MDEHKRLTKNGLSASHFGSGFVVECSAVRQLGGLSLCFFDGPSVFRVYPPAVFSCVFVELEFRVRGCTCINRCNVSG